MRKKYLSALLFGALVMASTATFTSCKDYDDDIDNLQSQITANADAIKKLQDLVGAGKFVTNVSKVTDGITITWNDGSSTTLNGTDGKDGKDGKDGSVITIGENNNWFIDGKDTGVCAKGEDGAAAEAGKDGADGHDAAIIDGYWAVWNAETGTYEKTKFIAGGVRVVEVKGGYKLTINNADGSEQSIVLPTSADLISISQVMVDEYDGEHDIFYGLVKTDVEWDGAKAVDGKMLAGMYPTIDEEILVMLNPTGVDGTLYSFDFKDTDGVKPWGLEVGDIKPYTGEKLTRTASASGIWVLPREIKRIPLNELNERADFSTQFKSNDEYSNYAFALCATTDNGNEIKSQYNYEFNPYNVNNMKASDFYADLSKNNYKWGEWQTPELDMWNYQGTLTGLEGAYLSEVIYDYKLSIDKTKMTQVQIDKYGLEISEDGYSFRCAKEAAVDNYIYLKLDYILVNGSKASKAVSARIFNKDIQVVSNHIGTITAAFDAEKVFTHAITALNNKFVYSNSIEFDLEATLGANYAEWMDAMYNNLKGAVNKAQVLKDGATVLGGDPINNDATYNHALINNLIYFDLVDADGKSCVYGVSDAKLLEKLATVKALKVYFIAATCQWNSSTRTYDLVDNNPVKAPFYTASGSTSWSNGFAIPLNNAFRVELAATKEEQKVAAFNFTFELTQPTMDIEHQNGRFTRWTKDADGCTVLNVYGAYGKVGSGTAGDKMYLPLYDSFDQWIAKGSNPYFEFKENDKYYTLNYAKGAANGVTFQNFNTANTNLTITLNNNNPYIPNWENYTTTATKAGSLLANSIADVTNGQPDAYIPVDAAYNFYGVYPATQAQLGGFYNNGTANKTGFKMVFASLLKHSTIETVTELKTAPGSNGVFISDDDLNLTTPLGGKFYLFDGLDENQTIASRATLNALSFNEAQRPFSSVDELTDGTSCSWEVKATFGDIPSSSLQSTPLLMNGTKGEGGQFTWVADPATGVRTIKGNVAGVQENQVVVSNVRAVAKRNTQASDHTAAAVVSGVKGGLYIQLPNSVEDGQKVTVTVTLKDALGYEKKVNFVIEKIS